MFSARSEAVVWRRLSDKLALAGDSLSTEPAAALLTSDSLCAIVGLLS